MESTMEIDIDNVMVLLNMDYKQPIEVIKLLKRGQIIPLISLVGYELRQRGDKIMLYTHS